MKKAMAFLKKNWIFVAIGAFIVGVGSISGAIGRAKQVASNPTSAVTK